MNPKKSASSATSKATPAATSSNISQDKIADRARTIWEQHGRPEGRDLEHWLEAERQLREKSHPTAELTDEDIESDKNVDGLVQRPRER